MRAYTVKEIDDLRQACEMRFLWGTTNPTGEMYCSRQYKESEKILAVEELVRTYMTAGITAEDIQKQDEL